MKPQHLAQKIICAKCQHVHVLEREILDTKTFRVVCHSCENLIVGHFQPEQITKYLEQKRNLGKPTQ